ncbi:MAG: YdcF family protein [Cyanobacteria bacterium P01_F01_bin.53]
MLAPTLCQRVSPTRMWAILSASITFGISHRPGLLVLAALAIASLLFAWRQPWRQRRGKTSARRSGQYSPSKYRPIKHLPLKKITITLVVGLLLVYLALTSPFSTGLGDRLLVGAVPPDSGEKADAIVVLGRGKRQVEVHSQAVAYLWRAKRAPLIFPSGRKDAPLMANWLKAKGGVPASAITGEPCSLTTDQNAEFTAALLWPQGIRKIILVTDPLHMLWSTLTFQSLGFEVIPHMVPFNSDNQASKSRFLVIRESVGLLSYGIMGRYRDREVPSESIIYANTR